MGGLRLRYAHIPFAGITQIRSRGRPASRNLSAWKNPSSPRVYVSLDGSISEVRGQCQCPVFPPESGEST